MLGMCFILVVFNILIFWLFVVDFPPELETVASDNAETAIKQTLYLADALILLLVGVMSYLLAGRALAPIRETYLRQKTFVADAAHDLRTPLAILRSGAELALTGPQNLDAYREVVSGSIEEVELLSNLVNDLLLLARQDAGFEGNFEDLDLAALVEGQKAPLGLLANQDVSIDWDVCAACTIKGDRLLLIRMLRNMVQNAIDHNKPAGKVIVRLYCGSDKAMLEISDTGVGISAVDQSHIFEPFFKVDQSRGGTTAGSGLGLSIVRGIVLAHGGSINVESMPGAGSMFKIQIPKK